MLFCTSLSTEWVDYVEEPMKYQALRPYFFYVGGWGLVGGVGVVGDGVHGVLVRDVVGGGMGDGVLSGW